MMNASTLDEAEVLKAFLAIEAKPACRFPACRHIIMFRKTEGQPGLGQQQA